MSYVANFTDHVAAADALAAYVAKEAPLGSVARASQLGLSFIIGQMKADTGHLDRFVAEGGNMQKVLEQDLPTFGQFIARHPGALAAMAAWTSQATSKVGNLIERTAALLSVEGDDVTVPYLTAALREPRSEADFVQALVALARAEVHTAPRFTRMAILAAALVATGTVVATLEALKAKGLNLLVTLTPTRFGEALATGLIPWEIVRQWSAATAAAARDGNQQQAASSHAGQDIVADFLVAEHPQHHEIPGHLKQQKKGTHDIKEADFQDLRAMQYPPDPVAMEGAFQALSLHPASPPGTAICMFDPPHMEDQRARRWAWWGAMARIKIFVREFYAFTKYSGTQRPGGLVVPNALASGNPGQLVVRTTIGTATWVPNDRRIIVSPGSTELHRRITMGFPAWNPELYMSKKYHRNRIPQQIAALYAASSSGQGFQ